MGSGDIFNREEFKLLFNFISAKGIRYKKISHLETGAEMAEATTRATAAAMADEEGSSEDEDFIANDNEEDPDEEYVLCVSESNWVCDECVW